jgi:hypothetical protein
MTVCGLHFAEERGKLQQLSVVAIFRNRHLERITGAMIRPRIFLGSHAESTEPSPHCGWSFVWNFRDARLIKVSE